MLLRFLFEGRLAKTSGKPNISAQARAACDTKRPLLLGCGVKGNREKI